MVAEFTGEEIIELTSGRLAQGMMPDEAGSICWDTRQLDEGQWFIALPGKRFDGHDFIGEAFSMGALGCIVEERGNYPIASTSFPLLAVDHTYDAFQQLARNWRRRLNPRVIAVTSSRLDPSPVLKLCAAVLENQYRTLVLEDGRVEALLSAEVQLKEDVQLVIAAVAPDELAQAELIGRALAPTVVVLTESGFSHLRAANEDLIARAECDLLAHLEKHRGIGVVARSSDDLLHRIKYHFSDRTVVLSEADAAPASADDRLNLAAADVDTSPANVWCTIKACTHLGATPQQIAQGLSSIEL